MYSWLHEIPAGNAQVITASRRLSLELRAAYDEEQIAHGARSWLTPAINAWPDWLDSQIEAVKDPQSVPSRIDAYSAAIVWENCFRQQISQDVLNFAGTVRQTRQAWQLVCDWSVPVAALQKSAGNADEKQFARTARAYQRQLAESNWVDSAMLPALVMQLIADRLVDVTGHFVFAGFDRLSPVVSAMVEALGAAGCDVTVQQKEVAKPTLAVASLQNEQSELRTAGAWARGLLEKVPGAKVAIIKPNLESAADASLRLVLEGLAPGWQLGGNTFRRAANVSYGRKLTDFPLVHTALLLLGWLHRGLDTRQIGVLLRSKCVGSGEIAGRCLLEHEFRKYPDRVWDIDTFVAAIGASPQAPDVGMFVAGLRGAAENLAKAGKVRGPAAWAEEIDTLLQLLHWPGSQVPDSEEFQLLNRWRKLLNEFARTTIVTQRLTFAETVQRLGIMAAETVYQAQTETDAVQLLGTLEAAGMQFDAVWVCGLDAAQWPAPGRPSPYVSRALQRDYQMPDSTPADTLQFSRRVLHRLLASAPQQVVSWSRERDDTEMTVSPLLDEYTLTQYAGPADQGWFAHDYVSAAALTSSDDKSVPALQCDEHVMGGAYTIQRQAEEPFSAFVHGRLGVSHAETIGPGISPRQRGILTHDALQNLFSDCPRQRDIATWSEEVRLRRIGSAVDSALSRLSRFADDALKHVLLLERTRLMNLLDEFVSQELERSEFSIASVEDAINYERGELRLGLRVDRIDTMPDGSSLIIDYKTGAPRGFLNKDGEPSDLQLVVYADALRAPVGGLAIINIDSKQISYKGAGSDLPGVKPDTEPWPERLGEWIQLVHQAMDDFTRGDVRINVSAATAKSRPLQVLSRIEELKRAQ